MNAHTHTLKPFTVLSVIQNHLDFVPIPEESVGIGHPTSFFIIISPNMFQVHKFLFLSIHNLKFFVF